MTERIVLFVALAFVLGGGASAINASFAHTGDETSISGEKWTPNAGSVTTLNNSNLDTAIYSPSVKVYDENGTRVLEGEDYRWFRSNGTVKALSGGDLDGDANATVDYEFHEPDSTSRDVATLLGRGLNVSAFFIFVVGIGIVFGAARKFGGL